MDKISRRTILSLPLLGLFGRHAWGQLPKPVPYSEIVAAAQKEGSVLVYSVMAADSWRPAIQGFNRKYPTITVTTLDLPSAPECFERYLAETATNSKTCDLLMTQGRDQWIDFHRRGELLEYESPESGAWPAWSKPFKGMYTTSLVSVLFVWNNLLVPEGQRPKTMAEFVRSATANAATWRNRITTFTPLQGIFGYSINYAYVRRHGEKAWGWFAELAKLAPRFERSSGPMVEKIVSGEYIAGWFCASTVLWARLNDPVRSKVLGWSFMHDGQPMLLNGIGIPRRARNINAAKVFLDYLLSAEGQREFGKAGVTPARPDIKTGDGVRYTYTSIVEAVGGEANVNRIDWDPADVWDREGFLAKWRRTFNIT